MSFLSFEGYHGTSCLNAKDIETKGFELSVGDDQWLGDGVYFFTHGISEHPEDQAEKWALVESYRRSYEFYSVLKATINVDENKCLDLSDYDTSNYIDKIAVAICRKLRINSISEGVVINYIRKHNLTGDDIDVAIGDVYIKLTEEARKYRVNRFTPNCTIMAVFNKECITDVTNYKTGRI